MASLANHVQLTITQDSVGIARAGFGVPLILSASAAWAERTRTYNSAAEVLTDFPTVASGPAPEYLAASAMFAQSPRPSRIMIGRSALKPTQVYTLSVGAVRNSHAYSIIVKGEGFGGGTATYTSDANATDAEIATGLVAALNAISGNNYIAAGTASPFTVTADTAGDWFSLQVEPTDLSIAQTHVDPGVATDLAAIALESSAWYALHTLYNSDAYVKAAAAWVEANRKLYLFDTNETEAILDASDGTQGTLDDIGALNYARTSGWYHPDPSAMLAAAVYGRVLPLEPGAESWKFKFLAGVVAVSMTGTHRANLIARSANSYEDVAGVGVTFEGTTSDGDFIDVTRGLDWLEDDLTKGVFGALAGASKIPYTDAGVAVIEAQVRASLLRAVRRGILAEDPSPVVTVPKVADVSVSDRALRILPDVSFSATLAGAIHKVTITGVVSV